jgi:hypothetical protein
MGARLYDPALGRFLSTDPVANGSCNTYNYVCANPLAQSDLSGTSLKERTQTHCTRYACVRIRRICDTKTNMRCSLNWDFHFRGSWASAYINPGFHYSIYDNGYRFTGGSYSHGEFGSYTFHGAWYSNNAQAHGRGWFRCGWFTCHVDPGDSLTFTAEGTAWYRGEEVRWSLGQNFSGGGSYR